MTIGEHGIAASHEGIREQPVAQFSLLAECPYTEHCQGGVCSSRFGADGEGCIVVAFIHTAFHRCAEVGQVIVTTDRACHESHKNHQ